MMAPVRGSLDRADCVHGDECGDDDAGVERLAGGADAALHRTIAAGELGDGRAGTRAHGALRDAASARSRCGAVAGVCVRRLGTADGEVEEDRGGDDGDAQAGHLDADVALGEEAHDAAGRVEAEGGATAEQDGVDLLDDVAGAQEIGFARAGGGAADIDAAHGAGRAEHDGAAGGGATVGPVTHADTGDIRERVSSIVDAGAGASPRGGHRCVRPPAPRARVPGSPHRGIRGSGAGRGPAPGGSRWRGRRCSG
jgi:hypothetical protein